MKALSAGQALPERDGFQMGTFVLLKSSPGKATRPSSCDKRLLSSNGICLFVSATERRDSERLSPYRDPCLKKPDRTGKPKRSLVVLIQNSKSRYEILIFRSEKNKRAESEFEKPRSGLKLESSPGTRISNPNPGLETLTVMFFFMGF